MGLSILASSASWTPVAAARQEQLRGSERVANMWATLFGTRRRNDLSLAHSDNEITALEIVTLRYYVENCGNLCTPFSM